MIKLNIYLRDKEFVDYFNRATMTADGLDQKGRMTVVCKGDKTFLYNALLCDIAFGTEWIAINEDDVRYFVKYSLKDIPDERQDNYFKDAVAVKGIEFLGVLMKNGDTFLCQMSELEKIEKVILQ